MRIAIFSKTFHRPTLDQVLAAIAKLGIREVHFNLACVGLEPLPAELSTAQCSEICEAFSRYGLTMCGVSGTFNAIHPDKSQRAELTRRACILIERCHEFGTNLVSLCTGTRDAENMWSDHSANQDPAAWRDLCDTLKTLLATANRHQVFLGIEPEQANVVNSAAAGRRLLDHFRSPRLKIILDAANLMHVDNLPQMRIVLDEAFDLLGPDIIMAHAKEFIGESNGPCAPGNGPLDWGYYLMKLRESGFRGPLVLHNLGEASVTDGISLLESHLANKRDISCEAAATN